MARKELPDILAQERQKMTVMDDLLSGKPVVQVAIGSIRIDGGTQMRAQLDDATVFEYTQAMVAADGWGTFPPVVAYYDGTDYWLGDGFHRVAAFRDAFTDTARKIPVDVRAGTRRDAILHAAGANANHGLRRTNADKRRAVETLLRDDEWQKLPLREIARICVVSEGFVHKVSHEPSVHGEQMRPVERIVTRAGTTYTQNTANIGSNQPQRTNTYESSIPTLNVVPSEATGSRQQGAALARCIRCGRPLSDPASAMNGIGPCCAAKRTTAAGSGADPDDDDNEEQPLQLATVEDEEEFNIFTPDRPKSSMAVHFSSESPEHYTPSVIIEAAIACMGGIDLDPCSNSKETPHVPAASHYTREDDGLAQEWRGCVYMNPPYGREIDDWIAKLLSEYEAGNVTEAIALVPSRTDTQWWKRLRNWHVCLVTGRLKFIGNDDPAPFPSAVFYIGQNVGRFVWAFEELGDIWKRAVIGVDYGD
jgi:hypothetical protein